MKPRRYHAVFALFILSLLICGAARVNARTSTLTGSDPRARRSARVPALQEGAATIDPVYEWITFIGTEKNEFPTAAALDAAGNIYVLINSREEDYDYSVDENQIILAKIGPDGEIAWRQTIPAAPVSSGAAVAIGDNGNIYVAGSSIGSWGNPLNPYSADRDVFVAVFSESGDLIWNTFVGEDQYDDLDAMEIGPDGDIYLAADGTRETDAGFFMDVPILTRLTSDGQLVWSRALETESDAFFYDIELAPDGSIIAAGQAYGGTWGNPIRPYTAEEDGFIAKIDGEGRVIWNTFMGGPGTDDVYRVVVDSDGSIYNCGYSNAAWGDPLNPYTSDFDPYIAKTDSNGNLLWHTFLGTSGDDIDQDFIFDRAGNLLLAGNSENSWGTPVVAHQAEQDGFIANFDKGGVLLWNTFVGSAGSDSISFVSAIGDSNLVIAGSSDSSFGNPLNAPSGGSDAFVANINLLGSPAPQDGYREPGPYVPEISRYIPTPLDVSTKPAVIGTNVLLAVLLMLPFAVAVDVFTRFFTESERLEKSGPLAWIRRAQEAWKKFLASLLGQFRWFFDLLALLGVMLFYGLVFSLLDKTWNPFTLKGAILFISMVIAYGVVGIFDDILQWWMIRRWGIQADFSVRPANMFLALISTGVSRFLSLLPGLMFGSPEALKVEEQKLTKRQSGILALISSFTYVAICAAAWLPTILTYLIKQQPISEGTRNLVAGFEAFLLVVFAVALENVFVQLIGFSDGLGQRMKRTNRWLWGGGVIAATFVFLHTLLNPKFDFIESLQQGNAGLFIIVAASFIVFTFALRLIFSIFRKRPAAKTEGGL